MLAAQGSGNAGSEVDGRSFHRSVANVREGRQFVVNNLSGHDRRVVIRSTLGDVGIEHILPLKKRRSNVISLYVRTHIAQERARSGISGHTGFVEVGVVGCQRDVVLVGFIHRDRILRIRS